MIGKYFVYILYSEKDDGLYVGCTSNVTSRLKRHRLGNVFSTRDRLPVHLIHFEEHSNKANAFNRERFLKSIWGAREKTKIKKEYKQNLNTNLCQ
jgi:putative endonuclease